MAVDKEALTAADHHVDVSEQTDQQVDTASAAGDVAVESRGRKLLRGLAYNMHYLTFLPLIIMSVLQDVNLLVAAIISAFLVTCILILSCICYRAGVVKVTVLAAARAAAACSTCGTCIYGGAAWAPEIAAAV